MATKTITVMEDAYKLLLNNKHEDESFSEEIRRILTSKNKRNLKEFFGLLSEQEGKLLLKDLEEIRKTNLKLMKERAL